VEHALKRRKFGLGFLGSQFCGKPNELNSTHWTRCEYKERSKFQAEFNCRLICKQWFAGSNLAVG